MQTIPWYFRTMGIGEKVVTADLLKNLSNLPEEMHQRVVQMLPSFRDQWSMCKKVCGRQDCLTESLIPQIIAVNGHPKMTGPTLDKLAMVIYPPQDQVTIVTSVAKLNLLDFLVYILSSLSFWFGFCPLSIMKLLKRQSNTRGRRRLRATQKCCCFPELQRLLLTRRLALEQKAFLNEKDMPKSPIRINSMS